MIKQIGVGKIIAILVLAVIAGAMAAYVHYDLTPRTQKSERDLRTLRAQVSGVRTDIQKLEEDIEQIDTRRDEFALIEKRGFLTQQNRREATTILREAQKESKVITAKASIDTPVEEETKLITKEDYVHMRTGISLEIEAVDDVDVYTYIYLLKKNLPGYVTVNAFEIERQAEISGAILRSISGGDKPVMVRATAQLDWHTMVMKSEDG